MGEQPALPTRGGVFIDDRGMARVLRVTWHPEVQLMVLSLWQGERCTATFRLPATDIPAFVQSLIAAPFGALVPVDVAGQVTAEVAANVDGA